MSKIAVAAETEVASGSRSLQYRRISGPVLLNRRSVPVGTSRSEFSPIRYPPANPSRARLDGAENNRRQGFEKAFTGMPEVMRVLLLLQYSAGREGKAAGLPVARADEDRFRLFGQKRGNALQERRHAGPCAAGVIHEETWTAARWDVESGLASHHTSFNCALSCVAARV